MKTTWKHLYLWVKAAVLNLDSVDSLLRQIVEKITVNYKADCLLWTGLELGVSDNIRVYTTAEVASQSLFIGSIDASFYSRDSDLSNLSIQPFCLNSLPQWFLDQQHSPQTTQLQTGDLIIPVTIRGGFLAPTIQELIAVANPLQFVLQLKRPDIPAAASAERCEIRGWSLEELDCLEVTCSQLGLAYSALYWRQRLEQSRQQAALIGRISRLLNSTLNPNEIVGRIVAELGHGLNCDRSILVDLRQERVNVLATWDHPERSLPPLRQSQAHQNCWQDVIEIFLQGGASYLEVSLNERNPDSLQFWLRDVGAHAVLLVPLFIQDDFFGAVALLSYQQERSYLLDELQTVRHAADQAAIALTNAQHYQSLWHKKEILRLQNNSLRMEIMRDELTQLLNRRALEQELEQLSNSTAWTIQQPFSIIVCDIDHFKRINDTYGHLAGDEVLQALAQRLQNQLRHETPAYRYGGEEFVIILTETYLEKAAEVAERLRQLIRSNPVQSKAGLIQFTASFGMAQQEPQFDRSAWDVLQRADAALYEAKRRGRDRVESLDLP
ncbi:MAG: sensor domain-containing diguanylate cyclase [Timaviella obliquedivisa GSE-PSE-MK23-08B]|jgi:diguanylate cyclase (GGDEF)-like protein|nr:sensor domain-containing diguanylate cyclase [Timaviella obliquedivisa GSE-PSE-MK23-08B]